MLLDEKDDCLINQFGSLRICKKNESEGHPLFDNDEEKYFAMKERQLDLDLLSQVSSESTQVDGQDNTNSPKQKGNGKNSPEQDLGSENKKVVSILVNSAEKI